MRCCRSHVIIAGGRLKLRIRRWIKRGNRADPLTRGASQDRDQSQRRPRDGGIPTSNDRNLEVTTGLVEKRSGGHYATHEYIAKAENVRRP